MVNENVKVLIVNIRRLTVCSNNLNVNDGMNLVPSNKTVLLIELMYYEKCAINIQRLAVCLNSWLMLVFVNTLRHHCGWEICRQNGYAINVVVAVRWLLFMYDVTVSMLTVGEIEMYE